MGTDVRPLWADRLILLFVSLMMLPSMGLSGPFNAKNTKNLIQDRIEMAQTLREHPLLKDLTELFDLIHKKVDVKEMEADLLLMEKYKLDHPRTFLTEDEASEFEKKIRLRTYNNYLNNVAKIPGVKIIIAPKLKPFMGKKFFDFDIEYKGKIYNLSPFTSWARLDYRGPAEEIEKHDVEFKKLIALHNKPATSNSDEHKKAKAIERQERVVQSLLTTQIQFKGQNHKFKNSDFGLRYDVNKPYYDAGLYGLASRTFPPYHEAINGKNKDERSPSPEEQSQIHQVSRFYPDSKAAIRTVRADESVK